MQILHVFAVRPGLFQILQASFGERFKILVIWLQKRVAVYQDIYQFRGKERLVRRVVAAYGDVLFVVPIRQQLGGFPLFAGIIGSLDGKTAILLHPAHKLFQPFGVLVYIAAHSGHSLRPSVPEAYAIAPFLRRDLEPEDGLLAPDIVVGADGQPEVVFIGALAVEAAGIAVNAADMEV